MGAGRKGDSDVHHRKGKKNTLNRFLKAKGPNKANITKG